MSDEKSPAEQAAESVLGDPDATALLVADVIMQLVQALRMERELRLLEAQLKRDVARERDVLIERIARMESNR